MSLLWVVGRISEYSWKNKTSNTIGKHNGHTVDPGAAECFVQQKSPDTMHDVLLHVAHVTALPVTPNQTLHYYVLALVML
jgi:hypothetical protein